MTKRLLTLLLVAISFAAVGQTTTGSISGDVLDIAGSQMPGARVIATHIPSGTKYVTVVRENGEFNLPNLQVGGPYQVEVTMVGYTPGLEDNIYIGLGADYRINIVMSTNQKVLGEAVVVGDYDIYNGKHQGVETNINLNKINALPTAGRELQDYLRTVPQASQDNNGGISIAGQNNRFNQIMIDGAVNNDVFGLAASGTNGGQSGFSPVSIDAVQSFQVNVSPYDVSLGNFTGGSINAVTRRGNNNTEASAYYFLKNQTIAGKTPIYPSELVTDREKFSPFATQTYGMRVGGALKKDKIFYFLNVEYIDQNTPQPFQIGNYAGNSTAADIDGLKSFLQSAYGYDAGTYDNNERNNTSMRVVSRLDFNLNPKNKLALSWRYTDSKSINLSRSSNNRINFSNSGYEFPSLTNSVTLEWNHASENNNFNKFQIGFTGVTDDRGPIGDPFPYVTIRDGAGSINFGTEQFSTANKLNQQNIFLFDKYQMYRGNHSIYFGVDAELSNTYNLFIRQSFGSYRYGSVSEFMNGDPYDRYDRSYSILPGDVSYDGSNAAAEFSSARAGFFVGDDYKISPKTTLTLGARVDYLQFLTEQRSETFFNDTALAVFNQYYDMEGARLGGKPKALFNFSPRLGINIKPNDNVQVRGGVGVFTGRIPLVWPGAIYQYTGNQLGSVRDFSGAVAFDPDPYGQYTQADFGGVDQIPAGEIDLLSPKFKLPRVLKFSTGVDFKIPGGVDATIDFLYSKNLTELKYVNFGLDPTTTTLTDVGGLVRYTNGNIADLNPFIAGDQNPYGSNNRFMLVTNNEGQKGSGYNLTVSLNKNFSKNLSIGANYTYGRSKVFFDGTSSQNSSQWRYMESSMGRNNLGLSYSDFDMGNRFNMFASLKIPYQSEVLGTQISFFLNAQDGSRYSYTYNGNITDDNSSNTVDLFYIPTSSGDINLIDYTTSSGTVVTAAEQWAALDGFISNDKYLSRHRGEMSVRNGARLPGSTTLDLKLVQDFHIGNKNTLQFTFDVFNFTNMLNKNWGQTYFVSNDSYQLVDFVDFDANGKAQFTFSGNANDKVYSINDNAQWNPSRWIGQFGVRYLFK